MSAFETSGISAAMLKGQVPALLELCTKALESQDGAVPFAPCSTGPYTYLKIKAKIKHLQKLKLNIFLAHIIHSLDKKSSEFRKKFVEILQNFEN